MSRLENEDIVSLLSGFGRPKYRRSRQLRTLTLLYWHNAGTLEGGGRNLTPDLPGVDDDGDVDVSGRGKLAELGDGHVLDGISVEGGVVGGSQHELQVVDYHVLDVIDVHRMSHCLRGRDTTTTEQEQR